MIQIIPAIDLMDGKCVRLSQGDFGTKKIYAEDPVAMAKTFEDCGISRLHLVDLDGAKAKKVINHKVLQHISKATNLIIDFGGGIQSDEDLQLAFDSGAAMVTCGSIAVKQPDLFAKWLVAHGPEKIILAADARDGMVAVAGWQEKTNLPLGDFVSNFHQTGIKYVLCTDVAKDGMMQGPAFELYDDLQQMLPEVQLIASGGVRNMEDIKQLNQLGTFGVVVGKSIYEQTIRLEEIQAFYA